MERIARPGAPAHYNATRKAAPPMYNMAAYALAATDPKKEVRLLALANLTAIADNTKIATQHSRLVMMPEMQLPWLLRPRPLARLRGRPRARSPTPSAASTCTSRR